MSRWLFPAILILAALSGSSCTTRAKARANANAAFIAGQQQAWNQFLPMRPNSVRFAGPVRQPLVEWTEDLTLAQAIIAADYQGPDPRVLIVHRNGQAIPVDPQRLLAGDDMPLERGDVIEIRP